MRVEEFKKHKEEELQTPLWIRAEVAKPRDVITNHHNLSLDKDVTPGCTSKQREAMAHIDDSLRLLGEEAIEVCNRMWHSLPQGFQIIETHSPKTLQISLLKKTSYNKTLRKMKTR
jgi:hypothetical protein